MGLQLSRQLNESLDTLPKRLEYFAENIPDQEMFIFYDGDVRRSYTFRQVFQNAGKFASRLRNEYGCRKGDIIANTLPNSPERLFTDVGIVLAGCVTMNAGVMFSDGSDFLAAARNAGYSTIIVYPDAASPAWTILKPYLTTTGRIRCNKAPTMTSTILVSRHPDGDGRTFLEELENSDDDIFVDRTIQEDDTFIVFETSGSTGYSKLVPHTHREILSNWLATTDEIIKQSAQDLSKVICYNDRPVGWAGGFPHSTYFSAHPRVLLDVFHTSGSKVNSDVWNIICHERVDYAVLMPLDLENMLRHTENTSGYRLKLIATSGQPIKKNQFLSYLNIAAEAIVVYGSSEAGLMTAGVVKDKYVGDYFCGQVTPGMALRIVDENGLECTRGQMGDVHVRGNGVFKGYLNRQENPDPNTLKAFTKDGWLDLGDTGYFDEDNNVYILGRLKDVIMFGASFIHPGWLEPRILEHPDIEEACVVPVSDPVLIHNICAVVKTVHGRDVAVEELRTFCQNMFLQGKEMEDIPVPEYYLILDEFPIKSSGKIDRAAVQRLAEDKYGSK